LDEHAREALAQAPDATVVIDRRGKILFASDQVQAVFGYAPAQLLDQPLGRLLPDSDRDMEKRLRADYFTSPARRMMGVEPHHHGLHKDGHVFPVDLALTPLGEGDDAKVICAFRDLTVRRRQEEQLHLAVEKLKERLTASEASANRSLEHLRLFVENAPASMAMMDNDLRYLLVSRRWLEDSMLEGRDVIGLRHYDVFPDLPEHWKEAHSRCLRGERIGPIEESFVRRDGRTEWMRWELVPWREADGRIGGVLLCAEMFTARKLAELALQKSYEELEARVAERTSDLEAAKDEADRANAFKTRFLAAASHDLRQPLQAAGTYLSVLSRQLRDPAMKAICDQARVPLEVMADIMDALLDVSKLEQGAVRPQLRDFRIADVLDRVVADNRPNAEEKGLGLAYEGCGCVVRSDPLLLERIIDNIVSNAIRYTSKGEVSVECKRGKGLVRISVKDTGIGIAPDAIEGIFDEYVQLGNPARDRRKGLGLGLSIARYIANILDHRLSADSKVGEGSVFSVEVPLGEAGKASAGSSPDQALVEPHDGEHQPVVLIVDDDPTIAAATQMLLDFEGFEAHGAETGEEALELVGQGLKPEAIVSDYRLPGYDGIEVIRRVRKALGSELPAVLVTGDTGFRAPPAAELPSCSVLYKPVQPERLALLVRSLIVKPAQV
jgi:PAS domain S-box-containing protein